MTTKTVFGYCQYHLWLRTLLTSSCGLTATNPKFSPAPAPGVLLYASCKHVHILRTRLVFPTAPQPGAGHREALDSACVPRPWHFSQQWLTDSFGDFCLILCLASVRSQFDFPWHPCFRDWGLELWLSPSFMKDDRVFIFYFPFFLNFIWL
jgi:hypothetical protein